MITITPTHATQRRVAALQATLTLMNSGSSGPLLSLYATPRPALATDAPGATALVTLPLSKPAGTITAGVLTLIGPTEDPLVLNTGFALWARMTTSSGVVVFDADVSDPDGAGEVVVPSQQLYAGGVTRLLASTVT